MKNLDSNLEIYIVFAIIISFIICGTFIAWLFLSSKTRALVLPYEGVVGPFFGLPAVLFSLTAALFATSIWENYNSASRAIRTESQGILNLINLSENIPALKATNLVDASKSYARSVVEDEWPTLSMHSNSSPITREKFIQLSKLIYESGEKLNKMEFEALVNAFLHINNAREARLAFISFDVHPIRWYAILLLGILVQIAVAFVHLSKPKALLVTMVIATITVLIPICMIAFTFSSPYGGVIEISNSPYLEIFK
jgi:hypothetical protein